MTVNVQPELLEKFRHLRYNLRNLGPWGATEADTIMSQISHVMLLEITTALAAAWFPHMPEMVTYIYNAAHSKGVLPQSYTKEEFYATVEQEAGLAHEDQPDWLKD